MNVKMSDDLFFDATDDVRCVEYIRNYLPEELKERFTDDDLFYFIDLLTVNPMQTAALILTRRPWQKPLPNGLARRNMESFRLKILYGSFKVSLNTAKLQNDSTHCCHQ